MRSGLAGLRAASAGAMAPRNRTCDCDKIPSYSDPPNTMILLQFAAGLAFLILGAEALVRGASRLAALLGLTPLVIGLTVVAFGTSSPELAVSIKAALSGQANIALGNVVGSNIFNVLFILGLSALVSRLVVSQQLVRLDVPLMISVSVVVLIFAWDQKLARVEGLLLFSGLVLYILFLIRQGRKESEEVKEEYAREFGVAGDPPVGRLKNFGLVLGGLAMLALGSRWLVDSAVSVAQSLGVSELVIALTIVAAGTSLPEVVTSIIAAIRGEGDIAVGNIVGSNLFNMMGVLGLAVVVAPAGIEVSAAVLRFDLPIMVAVAFACLPVFFTEGMISRLEGAVLFGYYLAYTSYLILAATHYDVSPGIGAAMFYFVIPLTMLTLIVLALKEARRIRKR
jgi:cation:H+ antiporter